MNKNFLSIYTLQYFVMWWKLYSNLLQHLTQVVATHPLNEGAALLPFSDSKLTNSATATAYVTGHLLVK